MIKHDWLVHGMFTWNYTTNTPGGGMWQQHWGDGVTGALCMWSGRGVLCATPEAVAVRRAIRGRDECIDFKQLVAANVAAHTLGCVCGAKRQV
jgi:hypothetical protein